MKRALYAVAVLVALDAVCSAAGCSSDLSLSTPGHDQCDATGQCAAGYTCDTASNTCVLAGAPTTSTAATSGPGTGGGGGHGGTGAAGASSTGGSGGAASTGGSGATTSTGGASSSTSHTSTASSGGTGGSCGADTMTDPENCGACGNVCPAPVHGSGTPTCSKGSCGVDCAAGLNACAVQGGHVCVDASSDPQYCGACKACPGGQTCQGGGCSSTSICGPGLTLCGQTCTDTDSDPANCGACGTKCGGLTGLCSAGGCVALDCGTGLTGCGTNGTSCADEASDPTHCGGCSPCASTQVCSTSACQPYVFASGSWECGLGNALPTFCSKYGICVGQGVACPP